MAERKTPSLSEVLAAFKKEANEIFPAEAPVEPVAPVAQPVMAPPTTPNDPLVTAAKQVVEAANGVKMEESSMMNAQQRVGEESERLESAAETLKAIAKTAAENHRDALVKEARVFGEIFAATVMDEFQKHAQLDEGQ